jgi:hypothetical protein
MRVSVKASQPTSEIGKLSLPQAQNDKVRTKPRGAVRDNSDSDEPAEIAFLISTPIAIRVMTVSS